MFVVSIADLDRGAKTVTWPIPVPWLSGALEGTNAEPQDTPGVVELELAKNGKEVMVRGRAKVSVHVPCVVTLEPLPFDLEAEVFLLLSPAAPPPAAPGGRAARRSKGKASPQTVKGAGSAARPARARQRPADDAWNLALELDQTDAARDTFDGEKVVLDGFLREFIVLELPLYPRRSDLPLDERPATATPPSEGAPAPLDPRLSPLAEIRDRLRQQKKE